MFYELRASSSIQIECHNFTGGFPKNKNKNKHKPLTNATPSKGNLGEEVKTHLLVLYCNKIIGPDNGLCITVSGIDKIGDARIYTENGATFVDVEYRLIMFKPYNNQIIEGEIATLDESGIRVSLGFFEQVFIPKNQLPKPSTFDKINKTWKYKSDLELEKDDVIHLKVTHVCFNQNDNPIKNKNQSITNNNDNDIKNDDDNNQDIDMDNSSDNDADDSKLLGNRIKSEPMIVYGTIDGHGLGSSSWWM